MTAEFIDNAIKRTLNEEVGLDESILKIRGFSTNHIRNLFHALCSYPKEGGLTYLEIGLFCGATFVSSFNKNLTAIGIENHSQDFSEGFDLVKKELKDNLDKFSDRAKEVYVHYEDCFQIDTKKLPNNIDIFMYDGEHSSLNQSKALPYFIDNMAKTFCMVIDDWSWQTVFDGTNIGFEILKDKIEVVKCWPLRGYNLDNDPIWHNSVAIFLINKK